VRLGSGATGSTGGSLAIGASTTAVFRVRVDTTTPAGTAITNRAEVAHTAASLGTSLLARSSTVTTTVQGSAPATPTPTPTPTTPAPSSARLSIRIDGPDLLKAGATGNYVVTVRSLGPATATNVKLRIPIPSGLTVRSLPFGTHTLRVTREGYESESRRVIISTAQPAPSLIVDLERARSGAAVAGPDSRFTASLAVESRPPGASVYLDGRRIGTTPLVLESAPTGSHALRLELDGYRRWTSSVRVAAGERNRVTASLEQ